MCFPPHGKVWTVLHNTSLVWVKLVKRFPYFCLSECRDRVSSPVFGSSFGLWIYAFGLMHFLYLFWSCDWDFLIFGLYLNTCIWIYALFLRWTFLYLYWTIIDFSWTMDFSDKTFVHGFCLR